MKTLFLRLRNGLLKLGHPAYLALFIAVNICFGIAVMHTGAFESVAQNPGYRLLYHIQLISVILCWIATAILIIFLYGTPLDSYIIKKGFTAINFDNASKEVPLLVAETKRENGLTDLLFTTAEIPLVTWQDKKDAIESVLRRKIVSISYVNNMQFILLTVSEVVELPKRIIWDSKYISRKEGVIVLGLGYTGRVEIDLSKIPHILIAGSTGSGKSELVRLIIYQCIKMGANVHLCDLKGGLDYGVYYHKMTHLITTETDLKQCLINIIAELQERKKLLQASGCKNVAEYNKLHQGCHLARVILVIDEIAEVTDNTGKTKEQKQLTADIVNMLSTIARLGRAFSINLVISTQRPDANILPGQIKNNVDCRICGRADNVLSQIILDSTDAAEKIPKDAQGRFIMQDGSEFQAYLLTHRDEISLAMHDELANDYHAKSQRK